MTEPSHPLVRLSGWVRLGLLKELTGPARDVLVVLAAHASRGEARAFTAASTIAGLTGRSRTRIFQGLKLLQVGEVIAMTGRVKRRGSAAWGPTIYTLLEPPSREKFEDVLVPLLRTHRLKAERVPQVRTDRLPDEAGRDPQRRTHRTRDAKGRLLKGICPPTEDAPRPPTEDMKGVLEGGKDVLLRKSTGRVEDLIGGMRALGRPLTEDEFRGLREAGWSSGQVIEALEAIHLAEGNGRPVDPTCHPPDDLALVAEEVGQ